MYPILIATVLASSFISLVGLGTNNNPFAAPDATRFQYEAYSDGHGTGFANYVGGIQRLLSIYRNQVDPAVFQEINDQIAANGGACTIRYGFAGDPAG